MLKQVEARHRLFDSPEEMLSPEALSELLSQPVVSVSYSPPSVWGNAGSEFTVVDTNVERLILKSMSLKSDWEMFATGDLLCRSVTLWQYGFLDQVRPHMEHKIIACAHEKEVWTILMRDLSGHFLWETEKSTLDLLPVFVKSVAKLHAEFWNDAHLCDARLGLGSPRMLFQLSSPTFARKHNSDN